MEVRLMGLLILFVVHTESEACTTPSGSTGACSRMGECPGLIDVFANYVKETEELPDRFLCKNHRKLGGKSYCSWQSIDKHLSQTTADISIDQFPWLGALISKDKGDDKEEILCQSSLINDRYINTAAHCTSNRKCLETSICFGEVNIKNGTDYEEEWQYHDEGCSTTEEFDIEESMIHHFYSSATKKNDVAFMRLNNSVTSTDHISHTCLPTPDMASTNPEHTLNATGWGKTSTEEKSEVKEKMHTSLITNSECQNILNEFRIIITSYNTCILDQDESKVFSCVAHSGGTIMSVVPGKTRNTSITNGACQDTLNEVTNAILVPRIYHICWNWLLKKNSASSNRRIPLFKLD